MYFYLNNNCYFIKGAYNGAIYDFSNNDLYSIGHKESEFIKKSEYGENIDNMDLSFFNDLKDANLGFFSEKKCFIEKVRPYTPFLFELDLLPTTPKVAFVRLNNKCSIKCTTCNKDFCPICFCDEDTSNELKYKQWITLIDYLCSMGLKDIIFTGGDPLLYENLEEIINHSISQNLNIHMVINGTVEIPATLSREINIRLTTFVEDIISEELIKELMEFKTVSIICNNIDLYKKLSVYKNDKLYIINYLTKQEILSDEVFVSFDMSKFFGRKDLDGCLYGKIYIDYQGNVIPCFGSSKCVLGNICNTSLEEILKIVIKDYWSKKTIDNKCSSCELYYACSSCRFLDVNNNCKYNPYKGEWN